MEGKNSELVSEVLSDAAYYNPLLRGSQERDKFEETEFFDLDHSTQGILSDPSIQQTMTATEYFEEYSGQFPVHEMLNLLQEAQSHINLILHNNQPEKTFRELSETLGELANMLFYLDEFVIMSSAINALADQTYESSNKEWPPFSNDIFSTLIDELTDWVTEIFINRDTTDIHHLDASIVSSCQQLTSFVK